MKRELSQWQYEDKNLWYFLFFTFIAYLLVNTGLVSDDFIHTLVSGKTSLIRLLVPSGSWLTTPAENYTHRIWYYFFRFNDLLLPGILKIIYISVSFYYITKFFGIFLSKIDAFLASFLFIFFPSHDATVYWFLGQYLTLSMAFYLYSYYLAYRNRFFGAFLSAVVASFISYGSPAIALALFTIFALKKEFKKGLTLLIPNILYITYYIFVTRVMAGGVNRIPGNITLHSVFKQFALQVLTFVDSVVGPSMWLKIYYSLTQLSAISIIVGIIAVFVIYKICRDGNSRYDPKLIAGLMVMTAASFVMFAITGFYPQMAFNLGNRVTIFGSLLVVYLIIAMPAPKIMKTLIYAILIFSILGTSDHWKAWDAHQQFVINNIKNNRDVKNYSDVRVLYVSGNQYSRYGRLGHIEFFSEENATGPIFGFFSKGLIVTRPINRRCIYENGYLVDTKYDEKIKVDGYINVYDSERDKILKINSEDINRYIESLPSDNRHWIQLIGNKHMKDTILGLMPRLKYAL